MRTTVTAEDIGEAFGVPRAPDSLAEIIRALSVLIGRKQMRAYLQRVATDAGIDLSLPACSVLVRLRRDPGRSVAELADQTRVPVETLGRAVAELKSGVACSKRDQPALAGMTAVRRPSRRLRRPVLPAPISSSPRCGPVWNPCSTGGLPSSTPSWCDSWTGSPPRSSRPHRRWSRPPRAPCKRELQGAPGCERLTRGAHARVLPGARLHEVGSPGVAATQRLVRLAAPGR